MKAVALLGLLVVSWVCAQSDLAPLPGVSFAGVGVILEADELGLPVVPQTYRGAYLLNPYDQQRYAVPDIVPERGITTSETFSRIHTEVHNKTEESINAQAKSSGFGFNVPNVIAFSRSKETRKVREVLKVEGHYFAVTAEGHTYFHVRTKPSPLLKIDADLETMLAETKGVFNAQTQDYWFDIFSYWGTYYVAEYELGGWVEMEAHIDSKRLRTNNIDYVKTQMSFSFGAQTTPNSADTFTSGSMLDPSKSMIPGTPVPIIDPEAPTGAGMLSQAYQQQRGGNVRRGDTPFGIPFGFSFSRAKEEYKKRLDDVFNSNTDIVTKCVPSCPNPSNWREDWIPNILRSPQIVEKKLEPVTKLLSKRPALVAAWNQAFAAYERAVLAGQRNVAPGYPRTQLARKIISDQLGNSALVRLQNGGRLYGPNHKF